ncbi:MAG TPA: IS481 family transposase [Steroidobacteraceae bacterium]|nr:IS481 family transposase [Steroidobacteraceae bacterium]
MDVHQNARLTFACRVLLVERVLAGRPKAQAARELGISTKTADKWLRRYRELGRDGLHDRRSRPHRSPSATAAVLRTAVVALRRQRMTLIAIATQLGLSRSTVARIARAAGLNRLSKLEPPPVYRRYERAEPGELLHLDVKKLGRIVKVGHRITGDHSGHHSRQGPGWEYLHIAIDDASRVAYAQLLPDEDAECTVAFLRAAVAYYAALNVRIKGVYTDNALVYRGRDFATACAQLGLSHHYTKPYTPRTNGKAERFIQTCLREWAYARAYHRSYQRRDALPSWLHGYNWHRPHMSLAGQPPINRLRLNRNNLLRLHS